MTGNEEHLAFFFHLGRAITCWQDVEFALYDVGSACSGDPASADPYIAFFSIRDFRHKLRHIDDLVASNIKDTARLGEWPSLYARTDRAAGNRNSLAHYWVLYRYDERPGRRIYLMPRRGTLKKKQKVPGGTLCVRDVSKLIFRFTALAIALHNFGSRLRRELELYPRDLEQEKPPLTLAELKHEVYAFANTPPG
jgi:hypothetical protein